MGHFNSGRLINVTGSSLTADVIMLWHHSYLPQCHNAGKLTVGHSLVIWIISNKLLISDGFILCDMWHPDLAQLWCHMGCNHKIGPRKAYAQPYLLFCVSMEGNKKNESRKIIQEVVLTIAPSFPGRPSRPSLPARPFWRSEVKGWHLVTWWEKY